MSTERLDRDQVQPPVRRRADGIGDLSEEERHARLLVALRALLELPPTRDQEPES
jgi:hypothetical protein